MGGGGGGGGWGGGAFYRETEGGEDLYTCLTVKAFNTIIDHLCTRYSPKYTRCPVATSPK